MQPMSFFFLHSLPFLLKHHYTMFNIFIVFTNNRLSLLINNRYALHVIPEVLTKLHLFLFWRITWWPAYYTWRWFQPYNEYEPRLKKIIITLTIKKAKQEVIKLIDLFNIKDIFRQANPEKKLKTHGGEKILSNKQG